MNRQIVVGDSKYVVISDPLLLDHVIRHMRSDPVSQLKSMKSVVAYFLTTDKAIITKLHRKIKHVKIYTNF